MSLWKYTRVVFSCSFLIVLFLAVPSSQSEQSSASGTSNTDRNNVNPIFDERQFISYGLLLASSPPLIKNVAENEEIIYIIIKDFYLRFTAQDGYLKPPKAKPFETIHRYLLNFEMTTGLQSLELKREHLNYRPYKNTWNPITSYFMFQRFLKPLREIVRNLDTTKPAEFLLQKQIFTIMRYTGWPTEQDLTTAISAILRIQHVYDLKTFDLSLGKLAGYETNVTLSPVDCIEIGKQALAEKYHALAVEWFEVAQWKQNYDRGLTTAVISATTDEINMAVTLDYFIKLARNTHDLEWNATETWKIFHFTRPFNDRPSRIRIRRTEELRRWRGSQISNVVEVNYWGTCSGENYKTELEKSKLFCWYETEANNYFKINPLKAELLSFNPLVVIQYYDLIGNEMIEKIKQATTNDLKHSTVVGDDFRSRVLHPSRTSLNTWIHDNALQEFFYIPDTIEAATGLKVRNNSASEMLQVAAYTTGSHYSVHLDALSSRNQASKVEAQGDRIATFIFYLTDVEKGGGTSFPQSGIASEPIKGSAVVWYNLLPSGEIDDYTWHGACPVIIGEKWICNKWIRSNDQMFLTDYQCLPDQDARYMLKINGKSLEDLVS